MLICALLTVGAQAAESNRVYDTNCALCHQKAGAGLAGQFPRLAGRVSEIATSAMGRRYLIEVTLFGMAGKVEVDGAPIIGVMPSFALLSDDDLASVLNYIAHLEGPTKTKTRGKALSITASEVKAVRAGQQLSPMQVHANREAVLGGSAK
jgi:cytochrome c553